MLGSLPPFVGLGCMVGGWNCLTYLLISHDSPFLTGQEGVISSLGLLRLPFSDCFVREWFGAYRLSESDPFGEEGLCGILEGARGSES